MTSSILPVQGVLQNCMVKADEYKVASDDTVSKMIIQPASLDGWKRLKLVGHLVRYTNAGTNRPALWFNQRTSFNYASNINYTRLDDGNSDGWTSGGLIGSIPFYPTLDAGNGLSAWSTSDDDNIAFDIDIFRPVSSADAAGVCYVHGTCSLFKSTSTNVEPARFDIVGSYKNTGDTALEEIEVGFSSDKLRQNSYMELWVPRSEISANPNVTFPASDSIVPTGVYWEDGRQFYRYGYEFTAGPNSTTSFHSHSISGMDTTAGIPSFVFGCQRLSGVYATLERVGITGTQIDEFFADGTNVYWKTNYNASSKRAWVFVDFLYS